LPKYFIIDKEGRHLVLVVESEKNCHVFPNNPTNRELVIKMHNVTFYYIINKEKGDVVGYKLTGAMVRITITFYLIVTHLIQFYPIVW